MPAASVHNRCETVYVVAADSVKGIPAAKVLEVVKEQHKQGHPDYITLDPNWTKVSDCNCGFE